MASENKSRIFLINNLTVETTPRLKGVPKGVFVEYFGRLNDARYFAVIRPTKEWDYDDFLFLVWGEDETPESIIVHETVRYRDGGTTEMNTSIGVFRFPTPFKKDQHPTHDDEIIEVYESNREGTG